MAYLTVVFAALAIARYLQDGTGMSIKKIVMRCDRSNRSACASPATTTSPKTPSPQQPPAFWTPSTYRLSDVPRWHESGHTSSGTRQARTAPLTSDMPGRFRS